MKRRFALVDDYAAGHPGLTLWKPVRPVSNGMYGHNSPRLVPTILVMFRTRHVGRTCEKRGWLSAGADRLRAY